MCRVLQVSRSGYYAAQGRSPSTRAQRNGELRARIATIHQHSRATYGSPRIHQELRAQAELVSKGRVARLMRLDGLKAETKRRYRPQTTTSNHGYGVPKNELARRFSVPEIGGLNRVW